MKKIGIIFGIIIVALLLGVALLRGRYNQTDVKDVFVVPGVYAGESFTDNEGNQVRLSDYKGVPLVINSWATWCPFCKRELPDFAQLQGEFGDAIKVIVINRAESEEKIRAYLATVELPHDIVFLTDEQDVFYASIGGFAMPETLFLDAGGNLIVHKRGVMDVNEMREHTQRIIN